MKNTQFMVVVIGCIVATFFMVYGICVGGLATFLVGFFCAAALAVFFVARTATSSAVEG